jgi:hypothetical protein
LHGLQAVAHVGQGAFHNRGHRVGQERRFDFIGDVDGDNRGQGNLRWLNSRVYHTGAGLRK